MPPAVAHPLRRYVEVVVCLALLLAATALTRCAEEPLPIPPVPPRVVLAPKRERRLEAMYEAAAARLAAYQALPPCAASGPLACRDPEKARKASGLAHAARIALSRARRAEGSAGLASARATAFESAAMKLPTGEAP